MSTRFQKGALHDIDLAIAATEFSEYINDGDDFMQMDHEPAESSGGYISTEVSTAVMTQTALLPGMCVTLETDGTDLDALLLTRQQAVGAFDITIDSGRKLAYEARVRVNQATETALFFGLCTSGPAVADLLAINTGILGDFDVIGFHALSAAAEVVIDGVTRILGGATQTGADAMTSTETDLFNTYGFRFNGADEIEWYLNNVIVARQTIVAATFPTGQSLIPMFSIKTGESVVKSMKLDYWICVQDLLAGDRPE